jgi:hypothetical protein
MSPTRSAKVIERSSQLALALLMMASSPSIGAPNSADVVCSFAPSKNEAVRNATSAMKGALYATKASMALAGLQAVGHTSGGTILLGPGGYITGTFAAPIVSIVVVPIVIGIAGTSTVVELACAPKNHPDLVREVLFDAFDYWGEKADTFQEITGFEPPWWTITKKYWGEVLSK